MILVVLGTHELPFSRLLNEIQRLVKEEVVTDKVVVQAGHTNFISADMEIHRFVSYQQMDEWYDQADIIISHAGTGSVVSGLKKGKVVIAVPRLKKYGEHNDDHQLQLIDTLGSQGYILPCVNVNKLEGRLNKAKSFQPKPFMSRRDKLFEILNSFIEGDSNAN